ncbi:MAG TPA: hypothetical protein DCZ03_12955 [Gammaproteobacteria bacterium]|nr:hypothetical protein [Gammaproteobacteria bacterium]
MKLLHSRNIDIECFALEDKKIKAIGLLDDDRGLPLQTYSGKKIPAGGDLHTMRVTLVLDEQLCIEQAEIEMLDTPGTQCLSIEQQSEQLLGLCIQRGFRRALFERIGGIKGCMHVNTLLTQMAPAILQASFAAKGQEGGLSEQQWLENIADSCHVMRQDGEVMALKLQQLRTKQSA